MTLLTLHEAAARCRVSVRTLEREAAEGRLNVLRAGKQRRVDIAELDRYLASVATVKPLRHTDRKPSKAQMRKTTQALVAEDAIIQAAKPYSSACGIYFLVSQDRVVYVGQSINVFSRLAQHKAEGKPFDRWCFLRCAPDELSDLERLYILAMSPALNSAVPADLPSTHDELRAAVDRLSTLIASDAPEAI